ncbi:RES family NAD+ phosphorylase [Pseudomonas syringae]|uniref:RES family NAD+ phosphorylase n=1 Tax=Pseudomonas syringae TaxID=317 RepID=UPI00028E4FB1|nr:RES family NAD+ phosphorylase [Pseudomonas syringae]EKG39133.1 hypothetical protein Pav037_1761 [Pseudomonas syringae pv. avellanae str. ISPaVe037]
MICDRCVLIAPLKKYVVENGSYAQCTYCQSYGNSCDEQGLMLHIRDRFLESYSHVRTLSPYDYYMSMESGADEPRGMEYWEPISDSYQLAHPDFIEKLVDYLEPEFGDSGYYYLDDGALENNYYEIEWNDFEWGVHHHQRFFNSSAKKFLDSLFDFSCDDGVLNVEVLTRIHSSEKLYRARKASSFKNLQDIQEDPISQLGPTPSNLATSQRMTPRGISAMYCARDRETCLSELRPLAGDIMISGAFSPTTYMDFLDLSKLAGISKPMLHVFDAGFSRANHAHHFLKKLVAKMSRPNTNKDELAYLSTQVVYEYLQDRFSGQVAGLAFPSVQTGLSGQNVVIFPESCEIDKMPLDGFYSFSPTLKFENSSLKIHRVKAVIANVDEVDDYSAFRQDSNL